MSGFLRQPYAGIKPERGSSWRQPQEEKKTFKHANIYAICDVDHKYSGHIINGYPLNIIILYMVYLQMMVMILFQLIRKLD